MSKCAKDRNSGPREEVSDARLHQHSGREHSFGGWEKVNTGDGTFWMRKTHR